MRKLDRIFMGLLLVVGGCGPLDAGYDPAFENSDIIGGTPDSSDPAVMLLFAQRPNSNQGTLCTATLIAPTVLLTAAHCVLPSLVGNGVTFRAFAGADWNKPASNSWLSVTAVRYDGQFNVANLAGGHDIAVAMLGAPSSIKPVEVNRAAIVQANVGKAVRVVGFGVSDGKAQSGAGIKRQATTTLDDFNASLLHIGDSRTQTCQGDSGGPAFMNIGGSEMLVGITSYGYANCVNGGYHTRADSSATFLSGYLPKK